MADMYNDQRVMGVVQLDGSGEPSGGGLTDEQLRAAPVPVTGPLTAANFTGSTGVGTAAPYADPTGAANGTMIALLKAIYMQLVEINAKTPAP